MPAPIRTTKPLLTLRTPGSTAPATREIFGTKVRGQFPSATSMEAAVVAARELSAGPSPAILVTRQSGRYNLFTAKALDTGPGGIREGALHFESQSAFDLAQTFVDNRLGPAAHGAAALVDGANVVVLKGSVRPQVRDVPGVVQSYPAGRFHGFLEATDHHRGVKVLVDCRDLAAEFRTPGQKLTFDMHASHKGNDALWIAHNVRPS